MIDVYLEIGAKRVIAGAIDWPGWCRWGKTPDLAIASLDDYRARYFRTIRKRAPSGDLRVVERLHGNATTDFGAPDVAPSKDREPLADGTALVDLLERCRRAFNEAADAAEGIELSKGPRGGGRDLDKIRDHVREAEHAYMRALGAQPGQDAAEAIAARIRGDELPPSRRTKPPWTPQYFVRRACYHLTDHTWEIQDRSSRQ